MAEPTRAELLAMIPHFEADIAENGSLCESAVDLPVWRLALEALDLRAQVRRLEEERDEAREIAERWSYSMSVGINLSSDEYFQLSADRKIIASWPQEGDGQ